MAQSMGKSSKLASIAEIEGVFGLKFNGEID